MDMIVIKSQLSKEAFESESKRYDSMISELNKTHS